MGHKRASEIRSKPIYVTLDGHKLRLLFDLNATAYLEEQFGDVSAVGKMLRKKKKDEKGPQKKQDMQVLRHLLFAMLQHYEPEELPEGFKLTIKGISSYVTVQNIADISMKCMEAFFGGMPADTVEKTKKLIREAAEKGEEVDEKKLEEIGRGLIMDSFTTSADEDLA
jgi:hypothetical protein